MERGALLQRSVLLLRPQARAAVPGRDVMRVLPCRAESNPSAGGSRESEVGEPELQRGRPVLLVGPRVQLAGRAERTQFLLPVPSRIAPWNAGHVARLD